MKYRTLGGTGISVSEIGFGAWGIGGSNGGAVAYGPTEDKESKRAIKRACELGINFFDTSDLYGYGHSEQLLGEVLHDIRHEIVIASKVGFVHGASEQDFSPSAIIRSVEASMKRLRTDYIDLYQLHSPSLDTLDEEEEIIPTLQDLVCQGKIRAYGISVRSPEDAYKAVEGYEFQTVQVNFSLVDQRALELGLFNLCLDRNVGVIARTPLCFGFLTGSYAPTLNFDAADHRSKWSAEQIEIWVSAYRLFVEEIKNRGRGTQAQFALRYCLSQAGITTVIPGMLNTSHVEDNVGASDLDHLPQNDLEHIRQVYQGHQFFVER
jgi:aryl-alcohol dehydrogenase-like predicted oxidoreductase